MSTTSTTEAEARWLAEQMRTHQGQVIVLSNTTRPQACSDTVLLATVIQQLPPGQTEFTKVRTTLAAIDAIGFPLKPEHREDFLAGWPVVSTAMLIPLLPPRGRGRPTVTDLEERTRNAFYLIVTLATERLRACADAHEGVTLACDVRRLMILEDLRAVVELPNEANDPQERQRQRGRFLLNAFREGQARMGQFYPGQRAKDVMQAAYGDIRAIGDADERAAIMTRELRRVELLSHLYRRAQVVRAAQHELSGSLRAGESVSRAQQQVLAHALEGGLPLDALMEVAIQGDLNPAPLYGYAAIWAAALEVGRRLGQLARGAAIILEPELGIALERLLALADQEGDDADLRAARLVRELALALRPVGFWAALRVAMEASSSSCRLDPKPQGQ